MSVDMPRSCRYINLLHIRQISKLSVRLIFANLARTDKSIIRHTPEVDLSRSVAAFSRVVQQKWMARGEL